MPCHCQRILIPFGMAHKYSFDMSSVFMQAMIHVIIPAASCALERIVCVGSKPPALNQIYLHYATTMECMSCSTARDWQDECDVCI